MSRKKFGKTISDPNFALKKQMIHFEKTPKIKFIVPKDFSFANKKSTQNLRTLFPCLLVFVIHLVLEIRVSIVRIILLVVLIVALVVVGAIGVLVVRLVRPRMIAIAILIILHLNCLLSDI